MYQEKFPQIVRSSKNRHSKNVLLSSLTPASLKSNINMLGEIKQIKHEV